MFSKKATKFDKIFTIWRYVKSVKSTVKIFSISVAFLENINFYSYQCLLTYDTPPKNELLCQKLGGIGLN